MQWDDLRYVLAVAETGSLAGAARVLGINHTTVLRRVRSVEERLGLRIFDRLPTGYVLTARGEELIATARQVEHAVHDLERRLAGQDLRLSGTVRVTTTDTLMASILPGILAEFRRAQPGIRLELAISNAMFNLTKRHADIAIRPAKDVPEALFGRRIAKLAFAVYAAPDHLAGNAGTDLADGSWIGPDESLADTSVGRWMRETIPDERIALRTDSLLACRQAAAAGLGMAALPCYLGDTAPELVRIGGPLPALDTELWILTHADLKRSARIRAFMDFVAAAISRRRALLEGGEGQAF